jgi:hypothetical protein
MTAPVGADIESLCTKCGDVWHVVVAKVGEKIAKVQCKQCGGQHRYKPLQPVEPAPRAAKARAAAPHAAKAKKAAAPTRALPPVDLSRPIRNYRPAESWAVGDRLSHPTFGIGVVVTLTGPGKIEVSFNGGSRVLAVAKAASALVRPPQRTEEPEG